MWTYSEIMQALHTSQAGSFTQFWPSKPTLLDVAIAFDLLVAMKCTDGFTYTVLGVLRDKLSAEARSYAMV